MKVDASVVEFIKKNKDIINSGDFDKLYNQKMNFPFVSDLTEVLYAAGIDPLKYMTTVPTGFLESYPGPINQIVIPKNIKKIDYQSFRSCIGLKSVIIKDGVQEIYIDAFKYCHNLISVSIPNSITSIGASAFEGCGITAIKIPGSVNIIENALFRHCQNLRKVILNEGTAHINDSVFRGCYYLEDINIPSTVIEIAPHAFHSCEELKNIEIPEGIHAIPRSAFDSCYKLKEITLPESLGLIGRSAFYDCELLEKIIYKGTKAQWKEIQIERDNEELKKAKIICTDGVTQL